MIPNPENVFELLQNDVATKLMETSPFDSIKNVTGEPLTVLTEDEGDIQFQFDDYIQQLGLCITVKAPTAKPINPDLPGPLLILAIDVWVSEAVVFNREAGGTGVRGMRAAKIIMETLHLWTPPTANVNTPMIYNGFDIERERTYISDQDKPQDSILVVSRICHFTVALAQA